MYNGPGIRAGLKLLFNQWLFKRLSQRSDLDFEGLSMGSVPTLSKATTALAPASSTGTPLPSP
jgi:hypothetical protein